MNMGKTLCFLFPYLLLAASLLQLTLSIQYTVTNNARNHPGGIRFEQEIGVTYTIRTMGAINQFIWNLFEERTNSERRNIPVLNLFISKFTWAMGHTNGDTAINISAEAIQSYPPGGAKFGFTSLMYHEMTHIFQWTANHTAPEGLIEGIADYVMVKSKYYFPESYTRPGQGSKWDEGYGVTERFLEYCESLRKGFVAALNKKMRFAYSDNYFVELLGKPIGRLWADYKAKYGNIPAGEGSAGRLWHVQH